MKRESEGARAQDDAIENSPALNGAEGPPVIAPPSLGDVQAALRELGEDASEAAGFHAYYDLRGWRLDGGPVRDWRKLLALWLTRRAQFPARPAVSRSAPLADGQSALVTEAERIAARWGKIQAARGQPGACVPARIDAPALTEGENRGGKP